ASVELSSKHSLSVASQFIIRPVNHSLLDQLLEIRIFPSSEMPMIFNIINTQFSSDSVAFQIIQPKPANNIPSFVPY
ncbi:MAG: hypothetical protein Q8755_03175, partial [Candidatus Phytoplasma australasiaticum]|nr:hypothetical protein [Candidatus Phytoplasma australasiaticum]